jgi:hypothetical protein
MDFHKKIIENVGLPIPRSPTFSATARSFFKKLLTNPNRLLDFNPQHLLLTFGIEDVP